jgi:transcription elongation factor/antiterminator RfaH
MSGASIRCAEVSLCPLRGRRGQGDRVTSGEQLAENLPATGGLRWYVVQSRARQEKLAQLNLEAQKFEVFLPQILKTVRHARRHREIRAAVFPGYLFIRLDPDRHSWRSVNGTIGVSRLLTANERPAPAPIGVVEALLTYVDAYGFCQISRDLVAGQRVNVVNGPFVRLMGEVLSMDDRGRTRVLLEIMGGKVITLFERRSLEAVA